MRDADGDLVARRFVGHVVQPESIGILGEIEQVG